MRTWARLAAAGAIGWITCPAWADTTLETFDASAQAEETVVDDPDLGTTVQVSDVKRKTTLDQPGLATFADTATMASGLAEIEVTAQVQGDAVTVDLLSRAKGVGSGRTAGVDSTIGVSQVTVQFTTTTFGLPWSIEGISRRMGPGSGSGAARFDARLRRTGDPGLILSIFRATDTAGDEDISDSGVLPAGTFVLTLAAIADPFDDVGTAESLLDVTFRIEGTPVAEDPIRWKAPASGSFGDASRWDPAQVPTDDDERTDVAVFDVEGPRNYRVTMGTQRAGGLQVLRGRPEFVAGSLTCAGSSPEIAAMEVGGNAQFTVGSRMSLSVRDAIVAGPPGFDLVAGIRVAGTDARFTVDDLLQIGYESEPGSFLLEKGTVGCGTTRVGHAAADLSRNSSLRVTGTDSLLRTGNAEFFGRFGLQIDGGGTVQSGEVVLAESDLIPVLEVKGHAAASSEDQTTWRVDRLTAQPGPDDLRILTLLAGGRVEVTGDLILNDAFVYVQQVASLVRAQDRRLTQLGVGGRLELDSAASIHVHPHGQLSLDGDVVVRSSGLSAAGGGVTLTGLAGSGVGDVRVGSVPAEDAPSATVHASGAAVIDTQTPGRAWRFAPEPGQRGDLEVGLEGTPGALFTTLGDVELGRSDGTSFAVLTIHGGSRLETTATVVERPGSLIVGRPRIADGIERSGRTGAPTRAAAKLAAAEIACETLVVEGTLVAEALSIEGDLTVAPGAVVVAEIGGPPSPDRLMPLTVTGTASLDGKLVLQFANGFAPEAGEEIEVLDVQGAAPSGAFSDVEVRGLAPGAQFDVAAAGGRVTATAVADTTALPAVSVKARGKKLREKKTKKPGVFTFTRTGSTAAPLDVSYSVEGTAKGGADFASLSGTVTIPAGRKTANVTVPLTNDERPETDETIVLRVEAGDAHTRGRTSRATLTIADDDAAKALR